jgi:hypothetical protein
MTGADEADTSPRTGVDSPSFRSRGRLTQTVRRRVAFVAGVSPVTKLIPEFDGGAVVKRLMLIAVVVVVSASSGESSDTSDGPADATTSSSAAQPGGSG